MRKWTLIIIAHLILASFASAQDQVGCNQLLEDAREAYAAGMLELVPELLNPCIESGLTGTARQEAYILVITSYLFDYLPEQADTMMNRFIDDYPAYQTKSTDPSEFAILLATHKEQRIVEERERQRQAMLEAQARVEEETRLQEQRNQQQKQMKQRSHRTAAVSEGPAIGFVLGTSLAVPQVTEPYSISDPMNSEGDYTLAGPGLNLGASLILPLSSSVETGIELQYDRSRFGYTGTPFPFTSYDYDEYQNYLSLPVSFLFNINPDAFHKVYFRLGLVPDYLFSASASAVRSATEPGSTLQDVVLEKTDIITARNRLNLSAMAGVGAKFSIPGGLLFAEARYQYGFFSVNKGSERYDSQDLIWLIYHVDDDFRLHRVGIRAGLVFFLK
jgi:hypothetical protein